MKDQNTLKQLESLNPWWQGDYTVQEIISRPYYSGALYSNTLLEQKAKIIDIVTGARRVGKTTLLKDVVQNLLKKGTNAKNILYITGELPALQNVTILEVYQTYTENLRPKRTVFWFIDEVQELANWQQQVKYLHDNYDIKFYLTGSSGLILNRQTSKLTGRFVETHLMPLSFGEFLVFKKIKPTADKVKKRELAMEYLNSGGYPEYVLDQNEALLTQTVESIMYRDLLTQYGIRNPAILKDLLQLLCDKVGTPVSFNIIAKDLKMDPQTAQFYLKYLQDVYLVYPLFRQGKSHKIVKGFIPKYYINDTGILRIFSQTPREGHLFENAVFLHLYREHLRTRTELSYGYMAGKEVDFIMDGQMFDAKSKPLPSELSPDVTYVVKKADDSLGYRQLELQEFLL